MSGRPKRTRRLTLKGKEFQHEQQMKPQRAVTKAASLVLEATAETVLARGSCECHLAGIIRIHHHTTGS